MPHSQALTDRLREQRVIDRLYDANRLALLELPEGSILRPPIVLTVNALADSASIGLRRDRPGLRAVS